MTDPGRGPAAGDSGAEAADLTAVKQQFLEAEQRLKELAQGAVELTRASVMLKKARMGISDGADGLRQLSERLSQYIDSMAELTGTLAKTSAAVASLDAAEIQQRLERMEERIGTIHESLSAEGTAGDSGASRFAAVGGPAAATTDEAAHGKLDRLGHQLAALSSAIEDLRDRVMEPGEPAKPTAASDTTAALETLDRRLSAMHGAVEELQRIAHDQLSAQLAAQDSIQAAALRAPSPEAGPRAHDEAVAAKLDVVERGLAAIHQIVVRVENAASRAGSRLETLAEPGKGQTEVGQKLDALAQRLDRVQQTVQSAATPAPTADPDATRRQLDALDARLAAIQTGIERPTPAARRPAAKSTGTQLGLYPDLENVLGDISNDLRTMEAVNVDMVAELRRSLGLEISRQGDVLTRAFDNERANALSGVSGLRRTVRWLVAGTAALLVGLLYLVFR